MISAYADLWLYILDVFNTETGRFNPLQANMKRVLIKAPTSAMTTKVLKFKELLLQRLQEGCSNSML